MGRKSPGLAGLLILAASCGGPPEREGPPVLVVGMDGLEWSVMDPLLRQGRLPAFAALLERGVERLGARVEHNDDARISMGERWGWTRAWEWMDSGSRD